MIKIAVDCMGGDHGPSVTLPACSQFLEKHNQAHLVLMGLPDAFQGFSHPRATTVFASEVVLMDDALEVALRHKKDSSMRIAIEQVKNGHAHAAVSAGNTGALMAIARYVLKTIDGIDRPAIAGLLPNAKGSTIMLDLGANVDCTPEHLLQFALMGSALASVLMGIKHPSVGLLNIGEEAIKGNEVIKKTGDLLRHAQQNGNLNFHGNIEGDDIFKGTTDVVVCDGFVGNVALKTAEGLVHLFGSALKAEFNRNAITQAMGLCAKPVLKNFKNRFDHRRHNGAAFLGLRGLVFKSHGSADAIAFENALSRAHEAAKNQLLAQLKIKIAAGFSD